MTELDFVQLHLNKMRERFDQLLKKRGDHDVRSLVDAAGRNLEEIYERVRDLYSTLGQKTQDEGRESESSEAEPVEEKRRRSA